ncbi:Thiol:disulfide oxidoreductase related to ResA [hydrothermal vent metagenome]|uniref:Thiol:disulfide oxidoreductase related to ResA n=1 Tax=hydrothermal vent metagenome TaxID=652676 RepID=A0A3B1BP72_9ZZZZ
MNARLFILLCSCCLCLLAPMRVSADADAAALSQALSNMKVTLPKARLPAPNFTLPDLKLGTVRLSDYRGKLVLLNFWASFCAPCRREMPSLENLWQAYADKGLVVLALSADRDNLKQVENFVSEGGYSFPILLDTAGEVRRNYEIRALPTSYLIGRDGKFIGRLIGERSWDSRQGKKMMELLLSH